MSANLARISCLCSLIEQEAVSFFKCDAFHKPSNPPPPSTPLLLSVSGGGGGSNDLGGVLLMKGEELESYIVSPNIYWGDVYSLIEAADAAFLFSNISLCFFLASHSCALSTPNFMLSLFAGLTMGLSKNHSAVSAWAADHLLSGL